MNKLCLKVSLLVFLWTVTYLPTWLWMIERWFARDSYYSHGILIPLVAGLLIWEKRNLLKTIPIQPSPWGFRIFIAGLLIHIMSLLLRVYFTSGFSMIPVLSGLILMFYGRKIFDEVRFAVLFLIFMVPVPLVTIINASFQLKLLSAKLAGHILNIMGFAVSQQGSFIRMAHATVVVDDACSGLRSLVSLLALGCLLTYWMKPGWVKKTVVFLSAIPIAVITNALRVTFLAFVGETYGTRYIFGFLHEFSGFLAFGLALAFLILIRRALQ